MKVLLIIAHGSRKAAANEEIEHLAARIGDRGQFDAVVAAFLEIAEPDIAQGIERCVALGARELTVVPYFLAAGNHVARDIPQALTRIGGQYGDLKIRVAPHLGDCPGMVDLVLATAAATQP